MAPFKIKVSKLLRLGSKKEDKKEERKDERKDEKKDEGKEEKKEEKLRDAGSRSDVQSSNNSLPSAVAIGPKKPPAHQAAVHEVDPPPILPKSNSTAGSITVDDDLWVQAYNKIKNDNTNLVCAYETAMTALLTPPKQGSTSKLPNAISEDPACRQKQMKAAIDAGLKGIEKSAKAMETVGSAAKVLLRAKDVVALAVSSTPQAAIPFAAVSLSLEMLLHPLTVAEDKKVGLNYVTSRMEWYCSLSTRLLKPDQVKLRDGQEMDNVRLELRKSVLDLYKKLLPYQMNDWDGDFQGVRAAEEALGKDYGFYYQEQVKSLLEQMVVALQNQRETFTTAQRALFMEKDDEKRMGELFVINPWSAMKDIQNLKEQTLLKDSYEWILKTQQYHAFIDWDDPGSPNLFWISGSAGTGKTMLVMGIITEIASTKSADLSFFFFQGTGTDKLLNSNTPSAAVRTFIWQLLQTQPLLITHLRNSYKSQGASLFKESSYTSLCDVLTSMLTDSSLDRAFLILDALDECDAGKRLGLRELLGFIYDASALNPKVKWLVSSRTEPDIGIKLAASDELRTGRVRLELDVQNLKMPINSFIARKVEYLATADPEESLRHPAARF